MWAAGRFKDVFFTGTLALHIKMFPSSKLGSHSTPQCVAFFNPCVLMVTGNPKVAAIPIPTPSGPTPSPSKSHLHWSAKLSSMSWQGTPQVIAGSGRTVTVRNDEKFGRGFYGTFRARKSQNKYRERERLSDWYIYIYIDYRYIIIYISWYIYIYNDIVNCDHQPNGGSLLRDFRWKPWQCWQFK